MGEAVMDKAQSGSLGTRRDSREHGELNLLKVIF